MSVPSYSLAYFLLYKATSSAYAFTYVAGNRPSSAACVHLDSLLMALLAAPNDYYRMQNILMPCFVAIYISPLILHGILSAAAFGYRDNAKDRFELPKTILCNLPSVIARMRFTFPLSCFTNFSQLCVCLFPYVHKEQFVLTKVQLDPPNPSTGPVDHCTNLNQHPAAVEQRRTNESRIRQEKI